MGCVEQISECYPQICRSKHSAAPFETGPRWFETTTKDLLHTLEAANMTRAAGF
jgi:hypothetical protein